MSETLPLLMPTLPGYARGITDLDPFTVQCHDCGATADAESIGRPRAAAAAVVILSGFHFHICESRPTAVRRCPDCLARVKAACESSRCSR